MQHHEEFLTEDFQRYAEVCRHLASLARRSQSTVPREVVASARWVGWADRFKSLYA